jgi:DNA-directed RNA polymerase subunit L
MNTDIKEEGRLSINRDKDESMTTTNATYAFTGEDHTLGNLLRNVIMKE